MDGHNIDGENNATLTDGSNVTKWVDSSGNGHDAENPHGTRYPVYKASPGGIDLGVNNGILDITNITESGSSGFTMFFVYDRKAHPRSLGHDAMIHFGNYDDTSVLIEYMFKDDDDDQKHCTAYESTSDNSFGCNGTRVQRRVNNDWITYAMTDGPAPGELSVVAVEGNASNGMVYVNGEQPAVNFLHNQTISMDSIGVNGTVRIGDIYFASKSSTNSPSDAHIAEIIIYYNDLSDLEVDRVTYYLSEKWGGVKKSCR